MAKRKRVDWLRVSKFVALLVVVTATFLMGRLPVRVENPTASADAGNDRQLFDFSDPAIRSQILYHEGLLRGGRIDSLVCRNGQTSFRVMHMAGMDGGEWLIAKLDVEGGDASLEVFEFSPFRSRKEVREFVPKTLAYRKFA
jgi:hypothetical protein